MFMRLGFIGKTSGEHTDVPARLGLETPALAFGAWAFRNLRPSCEPKLGEGRGLGPVTAFIEEVMRGTRTGVVVNTGEGSKFEKGDLGLHNACQPNAGETLIVPGAAGAGGSFVFQLGKRVGARVIGNACAADERHTFHEDFKKAVGYRDVYFDIVGGDMLDSMPSRLNKNAWVVLCDP
ncbi:hypothetical protein M405DRAFT_840068 [Rhizopogon salebrosus TDB-379]|nr:hypothetical protein M405DRAFT_840068 [Rhizopogon salebrosus TDB-379]